MLANLLESWRSLYANHAALRTGVEFMHIGGLLAGGGCAIAVDLAIIGSGGGDLRSRTQQAEVLGSAHRFVLVGLAALFLSGLLLFAADVETFLYSRVFWLKMGLIVLLLANGALFQRVDARLKRGESDRWPHLRRAALTSLVLWLLTTLAGAALPNVG